MIAESNATPVLLAACPSFQPEWDEYRQDYGVERLIYVEFFLFASHLLELYGQDKLEEFPDVFSAVEYIFLEGEPPVQKAVEIGLLEDLYHMARRRTLNIDVFLAVLQPKSLRRWNELDSYWLSKESRKAS